jgi:hypothetical protein
LGHPRKKRHVKVEDVTRRSDFVSSNLQRSILDVQHSRLREVKRLIDPSNKVKVKEAFQTLQYETRAGAIDVCNRSVSKAIGAAEQCTMKCAKLVNELVWKTRQSEVCDGGLVSQMRMSKTALHLPIGAGKVRTRSCTKA